MVPTLSCSSSSSRMLAMQLSMLSLSLPESRNHPPLFPCKDSNRVERRLKSKPSSVLKSSTSEMRPTRLSDPTYVVDGITHFCAPNLPSLVARTATHALGNLALPYLAALAAEPAGEALRRDASLRRGVNVYRGRVVHERVAAAHRCPHEPLEGLLSL